jgi:uncharacterized protein YndB with AHSA1/START domain
MKSAATLSVSLLVLAVGRGDLGAQSSEAGDVMAGKIRTDRAIALEKVVDASPARVFELWTTPDGVRTFFAPLARIEPRVGGAYEILFAPAQDPLGYSHGTTGARVLRFVPGRELAFEWITFAGDPLLGQNAPPMAPRSLRDMRPIPTWVELLFEPVPGDAGRTRVTFNHYGFRRGEPWDESYAWFGRAWTGVLEQLAAHFRSGRR